MNTAIASLTREIVTEAEAYLYLENMALERRACLPEVWHYGRSPRGTRDLLFSHHGRR